MQIDIRSASELLAQAVLYERGAPMGLVQRQTAVHAHMQVDGIAVADATGAQVVGRSHARIGKGSVEI